MKTHTPVLTAKKTLPRRITGQGMTEYIIVVALVALAAVTAVGLFGDTIQASFGALGKTLVGENKAPALAAGNTAADGAIQEAGTASTLKDY